MAVRSAFWLFLLRVATTVYVLVVPDPSAASSALTVSVIVLAVSLKAVPDRPTSIDAPDAMDEVAPDTGSTTWIESHSGSLQVGVSLRVWAPVAASSAYRVHSKYTVVV